MEACFIARHHNKHKHFQEGMNYMFIYVIVDPLGSVTVNILWPTKASDLSEYKPAVHLPARRIIHAT